MPLQALETVWDLLIKFPFRENFPHRGFANELSGLPSNSDSKSRLFGALGTFNYSYDNIYLADASVRFDGSSEFGSRSAFRSFFLPGLVYGLNPAQL